MHNLSDQPAPPPYLICSEAGDPLLELDDDGDWCYRVDPVDKLPPEVAKHVTRSGDKLLLRSDAPPLAEYNAALRRKLDTQCAAASAECDKLHARITDINEPRPLSLRKIRERPELMAWLNGENPGYLPTPFERRILKPAFLERRRLLHEAGLRKGNAESAADDQREGGQSSAPNRVRAHPEKLFPKGVPENSDLVDAIILLASKRSDENTDIEILREFTGETAGCDPQAKRLANRIRALRAKGRTTLPRRT